MGDDGPSQKSAMEDKADAIPNELLGLVFLRLTKPVDLVRAAVTCRRWHHIIVAESFRILCALHGAPSTKVAGSYLVDERPHGWRMPGRHPVFFPSARPPWTGAAARNLALDFLPRMKDGELIWELADVRGGLLLLLDFNHTEDGWSWVKLSRAIVCEPLARRYMTIPPSGWFHGSHFIAAILLHGEDARARISLSNFRVMCAFYQNGIAKTFALSPTSGGRWTFSGATASSSRVLCGKDYWTAAGPISFIGSNKRFSHCSVGNYVLAFDKESGELSSQSSPVMLPGRGVELEYVLELPWPPTFRVILC